MLIAVSVIVGFKGEVRNKLVGFGSHIQVSNLNVVRSYETRPIAVSDSMMSGWGIHREVAHAQRFSTKPGMIKTADSFQGMVLKGVGEEYDLDFFRNHLCEGEVPVFSDSITSNRVLLSRTMAEKLHLKTGDKIDTYYIQENVRARRLTVAGIYQTNFSEFDNLFLLTDMALVRRLNRWEDDQVSGVEIRLHEGEKLDECTWLLASEVMGRQDRLGEELCVRNVEQLHPQLFAWLEILDVNIWVILALMTGVAGFTMISGLLIIIIERTAMIGVLKSMGAGNGMVRRTFLWFAVFVIGHGMAWGNAIGLLFYLLQRYGALFKLDPETYYMDTVPVAFNPLYFILLNIGTLVASVLMLIGPSYLIARIHPATSMRYE